MGLPCAGERMLLVDSMSVRASACASQLSGRCTAIWSPSKSALKAAQTSGWIWIALPSTSSGSKAWMPSRCSVGRAVEHHGVLVDDLLEDVPDLGHHRLDHLLGRLDVLHHLARHEAAHDERLEELEGHHLGQAALVHLEVRPGDDHGAPGVVDALAEQVLAEAALLALEHVAERLERAVAGAGHGAAAAAVVEQRVDGLLQHALLVVDDDVRRLQVEQPLEAVVAVDDAPVEVVEVAGREAAAVELDHRAQLGRDDGDNVEDHPLRDGCRCAGRPRRP